MKPAFGTPVEQPLRRSVRRQQQHQLFLKSKFKNF